jgi:hypothetical protein
MTVKQWRFCLGALILVFLVATPGVALAVFPVPSTTGDQCDSINNQNVYICYYGADGCLNASDFGGCLDVCIAAANAIDDGCRANIAGSNPAVACTFVGIPSMNFCMNDPPRALAYNEYVYRHDNDVSCSNGVRSYVYQYDQHNPASMECYYF